MDDHLKPFACPEPGCGQVCFHFLVTVEADFEFFMYSYK